MRDTHDLIQPKSPAAPAVLAPPRSPSADHRSAQRDPDNGIRPDRVAAARARLAAGTLPTSAGALADAILREAGMDRYCRA